MKIDMLKKPHTFSKQPYPLFSIVTAMLPAWFHCYHFLLGILFMLLMDSQNRFFFLK